MYSVVNFDFVFGVQNYVISLILFYFSGGGNLYPFQVINGKHTKKKGKILEIDKKHT